MTSSKVSSSFKLGLIVRNDNGGLAAQTGDFYTHMQPHKTMLVNLDAYSDSRHTDESLYPNATIVRNFPTVIEWDEWLTDLDVVFTVECPYEPNLYKMARERGIKTVEQYNFEWSAFHQDPELPKPDLLLAPSSWRMQEMEKYGTVKYLHVPVDRQKFPFKVKHEAKKFLHIAGHKTFGDRNGTAILLEALPYIKSDVKITIRTQDDLPRPYTDSKLTIVRNDVADRRDLYNDEDVLILTRKYGGLSLQLNEAMSLGMVPIMLDIPPQNKYLDPRCLVPATLKETTMIKTPIDVYECTPQALAEKIDELAESNKIPYLSKESNEYARKRDWRVMKHQYEAVFESLCH